jgi:hypothetical protein
MPLVNLPPEVLLHIFSYLTPLALELLARTYHKHITSLCLAMPALIYRIQETKNARRMMSVFRCSPTPYIWLIVPDYLTQADWLDMERALESSHRPEIHLIHPFVKLEHLGLCGDLRWLQELYVAADKAPYRNQHGTADAISERMSSLEKRASELGLSLPYAFVALMRDKKLLFRIPAIVTIGSLCKVRQPVSEQDKNQPNGYMVKIMSDSDGIHDFYLYLDTQGGHCVLRRASGIQYEDYDMSDTILEAHGPSFEPWLAGFCFGEVTHGVLAAEDPDPWTQLPDVVLQYIVGFTEGGSKNTSRGLPPMIPGR